MKTEMVGQEIRKEVPVWSCVLDNVRFFYIMGYDDEYAKFLDFLTNEISRRMKSTGFIKESILSVDIDAHLDDVGGDFYHGTHEKVIDENFKIVTHTEKWEHGLKYFITLVKIEKEVKIFEQCNY